MLERFTVPVQGATAVQQGVTNSQVHQNLSGFRWASTLGRTWPHPIQASAASYFSGVDNALGVDLDRASASRV